MNKIVCDVCGTSYPDTSSQCPICGTAKTDTNKTTTGQEAGYAYVKGGRFSKKNVRKRLAGQKELPRVVAPVKAKKEAPAKKPVQKASAEKAAAVSVQKKEKKNDTSSSLFLVFIALLLVIAIVAVGAYIVKEYILKDNTMHPINTRPQTTTTEGQTIGCTGLTLALYEHTFTAAGDTFMLSVTKIPTNTTETLRFESSDPNVATVNDKGVVTAVSAGTATISVYCGDQLVQCIITCEDSVVPETTPGPTEPVDPDNKLELNSKEVTLDGYGAFHDLYDGELDPAEIIWSTSNEEVATVIDGRVTAVGNGDAVITAEYMGKTATCVVHCVNVVLSNYALGPDWGFGPDYTIKVGDSFTLFLMDKNNNNQKVSADLLTFTPSREGVVTIDAKGNVTAVGSGVVVITVTYGELTFKATVRVYQ